MSHTLHQQILDRSRPLRIHLIGVAGSGMSGLARLLLEMGHEVSGSDRVTSGETERLRQMGLIFSSPQTPEAVRNSEVVIFSSAIREENPALLEARNLGLACYRRAECLAALLHAKEGIVISGTHGKTTTSSMATHLLRKGGQNPCHYVGAEIPVLGSNASWNDTGQNFVAEGDESDGTLALYHPKHSLILNIEEEHLDFYEGITEIRAVFQKLIEQTSGSIVYCGDDPEARQLCGALPNGISYGLAAADWIATDLSEHRGTISFTVEKNGETLGRVELGIPGRHNVLNSLGALAIGHLCGVDFQQMARALSSFAGAKRRFETIYLSEHHRLIDDYGHHPSEITATLQTARSLEPERLVVLFQPHRFSRTQRLAVDFGKALAAADVVYVADIYPASEDPIPGITGDTVAEELRKLDNTEVHFLPHLRTAHHVIGNALEDGDLFLTLGAGNVHEVGKKLARDLAVVEDLRRVAHLDQVKLYENMRRHTTILIGGPAQFWIEPDTFEKFARAVNFCKERGIPVRVVGRGSNLLVRDGGIRGAVIHPSGGVFNEVTVEGQTLRAGAGTRFKKLANAARQAGLTGFEWMEGIPGNVGGGLRMNAGAMGVETFDQVLEVTFLDEDGEIRTRTRAEIESFYRSVPELRRNYALQAVFQGLPATDSEIAALMETSKQKRRNSQPLAASAGCIFKNPEACGAGQLIDELHLKGSGFGKAEVSLEHGNFIVNRGKATAAEVLALIENIKATAQSERGIELLTEVQILGEDDFVF